MVSFPQEWYSHTLKHLALAATLTACLFATHWSTLAQQNPAEYHALPNLAPVRTPSPSELLNQLLSPQFEVRVQALKLVNVPPLFLTLKDQNGQNWTKVSEARLLYGHYREGRDLAIIALKMEMMGSMFASVLLRRESTWERVGLFTSCCKYDSNPLDGFIRLRPVLQSAQTDILVHQSDSASGASFSDLSIFRVRNNRLENIYKTRDKVVNCHPTGNRDYCTLNQTRIEYTNLNNTPALAVAKLESIQPVPRAQGQGPATWYPPPLGVLRNIHRIGCEILLWDETRTSFVLSQRFTNLYCASDGKP
jgi:hypothetical protein